MSTLHCTTLHCTARSKQVMAVAPPALSGEADLLDETDEIYDYK
jgi:hypothetical protein